jgi:hypothetical protein
MYLTKYSAMKTWGSVGVAPRILNLDARYRRVVSFKPRSLYPPGKEARIPTGWKYLFLIKYHTMKTFEGVEV